MYSSRTGLILAFHGCDESVIDDVVRQNRPFKFKENKWDWLGHGAYFWDNSPSRALEFATALSKKKDSSIKKPAVLGAVIDLGHCLDLLDYQNLSSLKDSYHLLQATIEVSKFSLLKNKAPKGEEQDLLIRELDCAVIEMLHKLRERQKFRPYDSVRGVFWEGSPLYPDAGFREKDHIQICIRNPNCIKGCFIPRESDDNFSPV
jgi:hypothetical protein